MSQPTTQRRTALIRCERCQRRHRPTEPDWPPIQLDANTTAYRCPACQTR